VHRPSPQPGRRGLCIYISQCQGNSVMTPDTGSFSVSNDSQGYGVSMLTPLHTEMLCTLHIYKTSVRFIIVYHQHLPHPGYVIVLVLHLTSSYTRCAYKSLSYLSRSVMISARAVSLVGSIIFPSTWFRKITYVHFLC
jgi:hypothetical protein